jgi:uncharacterized protein YndB with AHSA1/START domain
MKRDLHFEMTYPHPREHVWRAITSPEAMSQWLMKNDFQPLVGHKFQFHTKPAPGFDGIVNCEVLEVASPERLVYTWKGGGVDTVLTWTLYEVPKGTKLVLDHTGFAGLRGLMVSRILGGGWRSKILSIHLPRLLDLWNGTGPVADLSAKECK